MKKMILFGICLLTSLTLAAYEVLIFGDVHFDSTEVRDSTVELRPYQEKEKKRNLENWQKNIPALMDRSAKKAGKETAFVLQLGDIVQGDCGSEDLHEKSMNTVLAMFRSRFPETRVLWAPGNHDIRGNGAKAAEKKVMIPYLAETLKQQLSSNSPIQYAFMQDKDLFVILDCNEPDIAFLEKTLAGHPERRHLFVGIHIPVVSVAAGSPTAIMYGQPNKPELRKKLVRLLAKNNAIILCAHIHSATLTRWQNDEGTITQISFFSIFSSGPKELAVKDRNLKNPFPKVLEAEDSMKKKSRWPLFPSFRMATARSRIFGRLPGSPC